MDIDIVGGLEKIIRKNDAQTLAKIAPELKPLLNRRNCGIFWRVLIDVSGTLADKKVGGLFSGDPIACMKAMVHGGLPPNAELEKGRRPIFEAFARSENLALLMIRDLPSLDANALDPNGKTLLMLAAKGAHGESGASARIVLELLRGGKVDPALKDQGASALFDTLSKIVLRCQAPGAAELESDLLDAFVRAGVDINAPRCRPDLHNPVQINTPLAYFLKKIADWGAGSRPGLREGAERIAEKMLDLGADPALQLEKTDRLALMRVCETAGFSDGLAQRLERKVLADAMFSLPEATAGKAGGRRGL